MRRTLAVGLGALCLTWAASPAHGVTGALCIKHTLNGSLKMRSTGTCKKTEIQIGSFDGTTLRLSGINLQIVSGSGATDAAVNGKGNLIVGYNANTGGHARMGSHNLVVGDEHTYTSYSGLVAGASNTITGPAASVTGGNGNVASGFHGSVTGGAGNIASGITSSVTGGMKNVASDESAAVSGGAGNHAAANAAWAAGGQNNNATAFGAAVSGGLQNTASGDGSSVSGGQCNVAGPGPVPSCVSASGAMSVSGGLSNLASGDNASVSGGNSLTAAGTDAWHAGQSVGFPTGTEY